MMNLPAFDPKQPFEEYFLGFDFANDLEGEAISTAVVTVFPLAGGPEATTSMVDAGKQLTSGSIVYFWIKAGSSGSKYKISCRVTGAAGSKYEQDGEILVRD